MAQPHLLPAWLSDRPLRFFMRGRSEWVAVQWQYGGCHKGDPVFRLVDLARKKRLGLYRREPTSAWVAEVFAADGRAVVWSKPLPPGGLDVEDAARAEIMRHLAVFPLEMSVMDAEAWDLAQSPAA